MVVVHRVKVGSTFKPTWWATLHTGPTNAKYVTRVLKRPRSWRGTRSPTPRRRSSSANTVTRHLVSNTTWSHIRKSMKVISDVHKNKLLWVSLESFLFVFGLRSGEFFKKAITTKSQFWDMAVYVFSSVWGLIEAKQSKIGDCYVNINWRRYQA